jgi:uncharacterized protein with HEPN domain
MPRDRHYLQDIVDAAALAIEHVGAMTLEEFETDALVRDAVLYRFVVIGEAVARISAQTQTRLSALPWPQMRGMRNVLIHEYDQVQLDVVFETVRRHLPQLVAQIEAILAEPWPDEGATP